MTKRSLDYLRDQGYEVVISERWFDFPERVKGLPTGKTIKQRVDLFGFADLTAVKSEVPGTLYVQTTSRDHQAERRQKIIMSRSIVPILRSGNRVHVHGWALSGPRGSRKLWKVTITEAYFEAGQVKFRELREVDIQDSGEPEPSLFGGVVESDF